MWPFKWKVLTSTSEGQVCFLTEESCAFFRIDLDKEKGSKRVVVDLKKCGSFKLEKHKHACERLLCDYSRLVSGASWVCRDKRLRFELKNSKLVASICPEIRHRVWMVLMSAILTQTKIIMVKLQDVEQSSKSEVMPEFWADWWLFRWNFSAWITNTSLGGLSRHPAYGGLIELCVQESSN